MGVCIGTPSCPSSGVVRIRAHKPSPRVVFTLALETTCEKVKEALAKSPDSIRCVDASWHLGGDRNGEEEFRQGHLPGAVFFDIDKISDQAVPLPHM